MNSENNQPKYKNKKIIGRLIFLVFYSAFLIFIGVLLIWLNFNPIIVIILVAFLFLLALGPVINGIRKSIHSRTFSSKKRKLKNNYQEYKELLEKEEEQESKELILDKRINLNFKYKRPLIRKCKKCGIILVSYVKKCPNCGEKLSY